MRKEEFAKEMALALVASTVGGAMCYGLQEQHELFDLLTGDTPFTELPELLQDSVGSYADLMNLVEDLQERYSDVMFVLRTLEERVVFMEIEYEDDN